MSSISALNTLLSSGSSGVDLSSILQAALGATTPGIDVTSAVNAAVTAARAPEQAWQSQQYTLQSEISALTQIQTDAGNLDNDMQALNSLVGPLSARTVNSSNANVVTASAASGATLGNHVVTVNSLATTDSWASGTFASGSTVLPAGTITVTSGSGTATINADGTTTTLSDVANQINSASLGVTASVVTDATGARLAIVSNTTGSAANFTVSAAAGLGFTEEAAGANAKVTVDGIAISSASNTVSGALPGITLNLLSAAPGTQVSLGVTPNTTQASTAINQFVTDYNATMKDLNAQFRFSTTTNSEGPLSSDSSVRSLQSEMMQVLDYTYTPSSGTTTMPNLSSMGITVNNDGSLSVDSGTLTSALQNNFSDVQNFFQGSAFNGFANTLDQQLTSFLAPGSGAFTLDLQSMNTEITDLQTNINNFETNYITPLKAQLQSEYSQAEIMLQQLPAEMQQINTELGYNNSNSRG